jgi:farnesyl diphosphate synthase
VQDDFLDCYGDPSVTGKIGTDIVDGKCSWLIVVAMQRANKEQKETLRVSPGANVMFRVTRLGGFSPIGPLFRYFGKFS